MREALPGSIVGESVFRTAKLEILNTGFLDFAVILDSRMAATLTLCASRKMLSSVCLLQIPLAFHCSMLNILSYMVGVWAVVKVGMTMVASYRWYRSSHWLYDNP